MVLASFLHRVMQHWVLDPVHTSYSDLLCLRERIRMSEEWGVGRSVTGLCRCFMHVELKSRAVLLALA